MLQYAYFEPICTSGTTMCAKWDEPELHTEKASVCCFDFTPLQLKATDVHTHSLVLSISVCYLPRLQSAQNRKEFIQEVSSVFHKPLSLPGGHQQFHSVVQW